MERQLLLFLLFLYSAIFVFELFTDKHKLDDKLQVSVSTGEKKTNKKRTASAKQAKQNTDTKPENQLHNAKEQGRIVAVIINNYKQQKAAVGDVENEDPHDYELDYAHSATGAGTTADRDIPWYML